MEFGRLSAERLDGVDFSLPRDEPRSDEVLQARLPSAPVSDRIRIGTPAWSHRAWVGEVYPTGSPPSQWLALYSRRFGCVELNSTHYAVPRPEILDRWRDATPPHFRFHPKAPQSLTHGPGGRPLSADGLARFCDAMARLEGRLGMVWLQLPPSFGPGRLRELVDALRGAPAGADVGVELRHPDWFESRRLRPDAFRALNDLGVALVITDVAGRRDVCHASLTAPRTLIRFVGNELHPTGHRRADDWVARAARWLATGAEAVELIVHQPGDLLSPRVAAYLEEALCRAGIDPRPPPAPDPDGQLSLL